jgi:hypothetical protein
MHFRPSFVFISRKSSLSEPINRCRVLSAARTSCGQKDTRQQEWLSKSRHPEAVTRARGARMRESVAHGLLSLQL